MFARTTLFRLLDNLLLVFFAFFGVIQSENARGAPVPESKPYALLYIPKKTSVYETNRYRRRQLALLRTDTSPYVLYWAIESLKGADLQSLPKTGKAGKKKDNHDEEVAWLAQHLQIDYLDGTGVLRIALNAGNPREQALLVNAVVHGYFKVEVDRRHKRVKDALEFLQRDLNTTMAMSAALNGEKKELLERKIAEIQDNIKLCDEEL